MSSRLFKPYLVLCALAAFVFQLYWFAGHGATLDIRLPIFFILLLLNANHQIIINRQSFSMNFPLLFPVIAFFGPGWASLFASIGLISVDEFDDPKAVFLFNRGCLGLSTAFSSLVYLHMGAAENLVVSLPAAALTYTLTNSLLFLVAKRLQQSRESLLPAVWETVKTVIPSMALAALFLTAYNHFDIFGIMAAFYVLITVRGGALFGHLETSYRVSLIRSLLRAVYAKDHTLMQHLENVAHYSKELAKRCGYPRWKLQLLDEASYFHDIGKLEIPDRILKKPGGLTDLEFSEMKSHPERGKEFLKEIPLPRSHRTIVENIAHCHHERYDGNGYPQGLKGEEIPLEARIVAIADTWDAMICKRHYRDPLPREDAIAELRRVKGTQLDPELVAIFIEIIENEPHEVYRSMMHPSTSDASS